MYAYLKFIRVQEILVTLTATKEQKRGANLLALSGQGSTFLDESTERSHTGTRTNHDDRLGRVRGKLEVRVTNVDRHVDSIVLVARTSNRVGQTMRIRSGITVLLLLQGQEVVGGHTLDNVVVTRQTSDSTTAVILILSF